MGNLFGDVVNLCFNVYNCTDPCRQTMNKLNINHQSLITNRRNLLAIKTSLQSEITAAEGIMTPTTELKGWLSSSEVMVTQLNEVLGVETAPRPLPEQCPGGCFYRNCCGTYEYSKNVEDLVLMTENQIKDGEGFGPVKAKFKENPEEIKADTLKVKDLVGTDDKFEEAWTFLRHEGFRSLVIHGMGGVGKSALLARIYNKLQEEDLGFDRVVWVEMSAVVDIPSARLTIGKKLGLLSPEHVVRRAQITAALKQKKFVLLLDDLRDDFLQVKELNILEAIGVPTQNQNKSKVVFTTRNLELCDHLRADQNIQLECLKNDDPWILFEKVVPKTTLDHEGIRDRARILVNLCGGLPLALVTMGGSMRTKTSPDDWNLAIQRLKTLNLEPYGDEVFKALNVSYDSLPNTDWNPLKSCFLYACMFPKTCLPQDEELIHYWIAEEMVKEFVELRENLFKGRSIIASLKRAYLLNHDSDSNIVKMHDMTRATALWITKDNFFVQSAEILDELPSNRNWPEVERISLVSNSIKLNKFQFDKLSTLILKKSVLREFRHEFFDSMPSLRVLDMSWCNIDSFPKNITKLATLQYLNISHTRISKLPTELQELKKLKFLDLSYLDDLHFPSQVLVKLSNLQSLNLYHSGFGKQIQESNALPADGEGNLVSSSGGGNVISGDGVALVKELEQLNHLDNLGLTVKSPLALQTLQKYKNLKCLHSLFITKCNEFSSLLVSSLDIIQNLKVLRVHNCSDTICLDRDATNVPIAKLLCKSIGRRRSFQKLCNIEIEGCWALKDLSWLMYAPLLQLLKIEECQEIEEVITIDENNAVLFPISRLCI